MSGFASAYQQTIIFFRTYQGRTEKNLGLSPAHQWVLLSQDQFHRPVGRHHLQDPLVSLHPREDEHLPRTSTVLQPVLSGTNSTLVLSPEDQNANTSS